MSTPSIKTLRRIFGDNAPTAKRYLTCNIKDITTPAVERLRGACFHPPMPYVVRLEALNELGEFYGVEAAEAVNGSYAEYLNTGETYVETLIYWDGRYRVQSLGDFIETMERNGVKFK